MPCPPRGTCPGHVGQVVVNLAELPIQQSPSHAIQTQTRSTNQAGASAGVSDPQGMNRKIKLFISHASEDKQVFAKPLADALLSDFLVWYDEYKLVMGSSLRTSIDNGLRDCDYGVVIFSHNFFAKKWTVAELNGLFALEDATKKIILPVWLNIGEDEVRNFSPMLADRRASLASHGVDWVVGEIKAAVSASERTNDILTVSPGDAAVQKVMKLMESKELNDKLARSAIGVELYKGAIERLYGILKAKFSISTRFRVGKEGEVIKVIGPSYMQMGIIWNLDLYDNMMRNVVLTLQIEQIPNDRMKADTVPMISVSAKWNPYFMSEQEIGFSDSLTKRNFSVDELASTILELFCAQIETASMR